MIVNKILLELPWMARSFWKPFFFKPPWMEGRLFKKHYIWNCPGWKEFYGNPFFFELP